MSQQNPKRRHDDHKCTDNFLLFAIVVAVIMLVSVIASGKARADEWGQFEGSVGVNQSIYTDESSSEWSFGGQIGHELTPVYLWTSYEGPRVKILGQPMGDTDLFSVGLGASQELSEGLSVFVEGGYSFVDLASNDSVVDEVVYTYLVDRHGSGERRVPVPCAYNPGCYEGSYEVDDGFMARIGAQWQVADHVAIRGAYKWAYFDQEMTMRSLDWQEGQGYWREDNTLNLSSFELGIWYTF
jgi:opacity protein-like surface antigen